MTSAAIRFGRSRHVALHYEVLSYLDSGRDAASLFVNRDDIPSWAASLSHVYPSELPDALAVQFLPLRCADLDSLKERLASSELRSFQYALEGINDLSPEHQRRWESRARKDTDTIRQVCDEIAGPLARLRAALWSRIRMSPWPLTVYHVKAMGRCGRAVGYDGRRAVAVSLEMPIHHILYQIFHEETHVVSDRMVDRDATRSTRHGSDGYEVHRRLERAAVMLGLDVIKRSMPSLLDGYLIWAEAWGIELR